MNEFDLCNYVIQRSPMGGFQLVDTLKKRDSIYGFKNIKDAFEEMECLNAAKDEQQLTHYIWMAQYDVLDIGDKNKH